MNATVNSNCIGCGLCVSICPEVFEIGDDGLAQPIQEVTETLEKTASRPGILPCQCHRPGVKHFRPLSLRQRSFRRPEGSVVCSPCCIFHNGHGCQFFRAAVAIFVPRICGVGCCFSTVSICWYHGGGCR